jgi:hypothetical protein
MYPLPSYYPSREYRSVINIVKKIFNGSIGALDGWLCLIQVPSANEAKMVKDYFSGHYQCYGFNVPAICDVTCSFISLSVYVLGEQVTVRPFMAQRHAIWLSSYRKDFVF